MIRLIAFAVVFVLVAWAISNWWKGRITTPEYIEEPEAPDVHAKLNDLRYGDISEDFATAIKPGSDLNQPFTDTVIKEEEKAPFSKNGVFSVPGLENRD